MKTQPKFVQETAQWFIINCKTLTEDPVGILYLITRTNILSQDISFVTEVEWKTNVDKYFSVWCFKSLLIRN